MNQKGQNVAEYLLLVVVVVLVCFAVLRKPGPVGHATQRGINSIVWQIDNLSHEIKIPD